MHDRDERFAEKAAPTQRIDSIGVGRARLSRPEGLGEGIDVDPAREGLAVAEQNRRTKSVVSIVVGIGSRKGTERFRIDTVVNLGPVETDQADFSAPFDGDLAVRRRRTRTVEPPFRPL